MTIESLFLTPEAAKDVRQLLLVRLFFLYIRQEDVERQKKDV